LSEERVNIPSQYLCTYTGIKAHFTNI